MFRHIIGLYICLSFVASSAAAQQPPMSLEKRIELAKKLVAEDRDAAIASPAGSSRTMLFTQTNALIEPQWTADFILTHPIKGKEGLAYENKTIINLLKHPEELSEKQILKLVDYYPFLSSNYIRMALKNLPNDAKFDALRKKLVEKAVNALDKATPDTIVFGIFSPSNNVHLPEDPEFAKRMKMKIDDFFLSGNAEKQWKKTPKGQGAHAYNLARLKNLAPEGFDLSFLGETGSASVAHGFELIQVLYDPSLSSEEKSSWLTGKEEVQFGTQPHEARSSATSLGLVAKYDLRKALAWSETAESPIVRILAKLSIAPALARKDKPAAIELVRQCYADCVNLDPGAPANRGDLILLNTAPIQVATAGLKIAQHIDADLLDECLKETLELVEIELQPSDEYARPGRVYRALAAIARYDRKGAKAVFDNLSEVQLANAPDFFVALVAIDPENVWEEYLTLKPDTDQKQQHRFRSRQAIATALVQRDADDFWLQLDRYNYMDFPKSIFE